MDDRAAPQTLRLPGRIRIPAALLTMLEAPFLGLIPALLIAGPYGHEQPWWQVAAWASWGLTIAVVVAVAIAAICRVRWAWHAVGALALLATPVTCGGSLLTLMLYVAGIWPATIEGRWAGSRDRQPFG